MNKQIQFEINNDLSFKEPTKSYFIRMGFKLVDETNDTLTFSKGSTLLNMVTFNPLNWKTEIDIQFRDGVVTADFNINTTGQAVTPKEEELWNKFIENYRQSITNNLDLSEAIIKDLKETKKNNVNYVMWALAGAIVFGVPFGYLAYLTEIRMLAPIGAAGGAVLLLMYKINKDGQKNAP